jgi:2-oxoglutarate/2-oxoacid ferredoxin oxidoreductase subunit alpha
LLAISWGGTFSPVHSAVLLAQKQGLRVSHLHLNWLNPLPVNLENLLAGFGTIVVAELNHGRLFSLLRERFRFHGESVTRQDGCNFQVQPLFRQICKLVMEKSHAE